MKELLGEGLWYGTKYKIDKDDKDYITTTF